MEIIRFDSDAYDGVRCPETEMEIGFQDENIADYIGLTFVLAVLLSDCPESCAIGGELNDAWMKFYKENRDELFGLEELVEAFPGPYKAIEVVSGGMACGPISMCAYYVVPADSVIEPIRISEEDDDEDDDHDDD